MSKCDDSLWDSDTHVPQTDSDTDSAIEGTTAEGHGHESSLTFNASSLSDEASKLFSQQRFRNRSSHAVLIMSVTSCTLRSFSSLPYKIETREATVKHSGLQASYADGNVVLVEFSLSSDISRAFWVAPDSSADGNAALVKLSSSSDTSHAFRVAPESSSIASRGC